MNSLCPMEAPNLRANPAMYFNKAGKLHRRDAPAVIWEGGGYEWYCNGKLHRVGGPAREIFGKYSEWYINGYRHRDEGPAIEWADGSKAWWLNGQLHRVDGPAVEGSSNRQEWYWYGELVTEARHRAMVDLYQIEAEWEAVHTRRGHLSDKQVARCWPPHLELEMAELDAQWDRMQLRFWEAKAKVRSTDNVVR